MLRRLWQSVESAWVKARWHKEIASTLGRRIREDRRLDFIESRIIEIPSRSGCDHTALPDIFAHARTTKIEITIFHPQVFVRKILIKLERQDIRLIHNFKFLRDDFDRTSSDLIILRTFQALGNSTRNLHNIFFTQGVRKRGDLRVFLRVEDALGQSFTVTQIDENNSTMVASGIHPADERDGLIDVGITEFVAMMSTHVRKF